MLLVGTQKNRLNETFFSTTTRVVSPVHVKAILFALESAYIKVLSVRSAKTTVYHVNSLLPTDFATLASQDGDLYQ